MIDMLSPVVTNSGWVYSIGSLYLLGNSLFGRPMYFPNETGHRVYMGKPYAKFLRHQKSDLLPPQPYRVCTQIDPWSVLIPTESVIKSIDARWAFENWLSSLDPRADIVKQILNRAGVKTSLCGLGGSIGLGCEIQNSDIDLLIFNSSSAPPCRCAIKEALLNMELALMTNEVVSLYAERYSRMYHLDQNYLRSIFAHDITKVYRQGQKISFIFTYGEHEREKIPNRLYADYARRAPEIRIKARIVDNNESWLYPRKYTIEDSVRCYQVWSHHWLRDPITPAGTPVEVVGRNLGDGIISLTDMHHRIVPLTRNNSPGIHSRRNGSLCVYT